jgi:hypothetical protein
MGPWTNNAHIAHKDVEELRQLVEISSSEKPPEWEHTRIFFGTLACVALSVDSHRTELQATKCAAVLSRPILDKEYRAAALQFNNQCYDGYKKSNGYTRHKAKDDVEAAFIEHADRIEH